MCDHAHAMDKDEPVARHDAADRSYEIGENGGLLSKAPMALVDSHNAEYWRSPSGVHVRDNRRHSERPALPPHQAAPRQVVETTATAFPTRLGEETDRQFRVRTMVPRSAPEAGSSASPAQLTKDIGGRVKTILSDAARRADNLSLRRPSIGRSPRHLEDASRSGMQQFEAGVIAELSGVLNVANTVDTVRGALKTVLSDGELATIPAFLRDKK